MDSPPKREKLKATQKLKKRGTYPKSAARIVRRQLTTCCFAMNSHLHVYSLVVFSAQDAKGNTCDTVVVVQEAANPLA